MKNIQNRRPEQGEGLMQVVGLFGAKWRPMLLAVLSQGKICKASCS